MNRATLLFTFFVMFVYHANAQTCSGTWGPPIVDQTFGQGNSTDQFYGPLSTYAPGVTTSTMFVYTGPGDNYSCLTDNATNGQPGSWCNTTDHTGDPYGLMFEINAPSSGGTVFVNYTMHDLCPNTVLKLSVWILNIDGGTAPQYPNVTMQVVDSATNTILDSVQTGDIPFGCTWYDYSMIFNNGNSSTVTLKFINNSVGGGDGNDLALDDITVSPCIPITHILPKIDTTVCASINTTFGATISGNVYNPPEYQWQYSSDLGATWVDALPAGNTPSYNFTGSVPGTYWVRFLTGPVGFSGNGSCSAVSDTSVITINATPPPPAITGDTLYCVGSAFTPFTVTGQNILWYLAGTGGVGSVTQPVVNTATSGISTYYATQTVSGCESNRDSISVQVESTVNPYVSHTDVTACGVCDGSITLKGLVPNQADIVTYRFDGTSHSSVAVTSGGDSAITLSNLCQGVYDSIVVQVGFCSSAPIGPVILSAPPLTPTFNYVVHYGCNGDTVVFTNTSQYPDSVHYRWDFGDHITDTVINPTHIYTSQDTFYVTLFMSNVFCIDSITDTIPLIHPIKAAFTFSADTICQGQSITFYNTSIGTQPVYFWDFGDGFASITDSPTHTFNLVGVYQVKLAENDFIPCFDTAVATVYIDSISSISFSVSDSVLCQGRQITFTGSYTGIGNISNLWTFGDGSSMANINPVEHSYDTSGIMQVTLTANYRVCPDTSITKTVRIKPYPVLTLGPDTAMCPNSQPIALNDLINAGNPLATWLWSTGDTTSGILAGNPAVYYTTVTINGCSTSDSIWVKNDCYINIPNAFTPNGDGVNDYFFPRQILSSGVTAFAMSIYNRWGEEIFETTNTEGRGWDGKFNNVLQPEGVFVYIIDVSLKDGQQQHYQGNVTLLK